MYAAVPINTPIAVDSAGDVIVGISDDVELSADGCRLISYGPSAVPAAGP
jgi:hypothetical protein